MPVSELIQSQLNRIKEEISSAYLYFKDNYDRYYDFRRRTYECSIDENQKTVLETLKKPVVECNTEEAYLSRLQGEFAKHEPSIKVTAESGFNIQPDVIEIVEGHIRHIFYEANKNGCAYDSYGESLSGGFSGFKVWTDFEHPLSFKQVIKMRKVGDPTLCGFDPMTNYSHKGDARFSFEICPVSEEDFKRDNPEINIESNTYSNNYSKGLREFTWSYKNVNNEKIVLVCDFYEKKKKRVKIVELANKKIMTTDDYKKLKKYWEDNQLIEQIPIIKSKRWTDIETICRYKLCESYILEYEETDYGYLPYVFVDGNSKRLRQGTSNTMYQMTRPYLYHAKGIQDVRNFTLQTLANSLENMIQSKFILKKEAIPQEDDYLSALTDLQRASTIVVNAYSENNPDKGIPEPITQIHNIPLPPEVMQTFSMSDATMQTILGSYTSNLGQNDNDLSGKAIIESASVGNAAAMPYIVTYLQALTQVGCIIIDLIPKYIKGDREIPIVSMNGEKSYRRVNSPGNPQLNYEPNSLHVCISAGVNFQVQKNQAVQVMTTMMNASEEFNKFMNSPLGLPILIKNLTIYGSDELQAAIPKFIEQQQQEKQQAMKMQQQAMQNNPQMIKAQAEMQKIQIESQKNQIDAQQKQIENQLSIARFSIEKEVADAKILEAEARVTQSQIDSAVRLEESQTSLETHALDSAAKMAEIHSRETRS